MSDLIRVAICDHSPVIRSGIKSMLSADPKLEVVFEGSCQQEIRNSHDHFEADIILIDYDESEESLFNCLNQLKVLLPVAKVIVLYHCGNKSSVNSCIHTSTITQAIKHGVRGFQCKHKFSADDIIHSIRSVHQGDIDLPPCVVNELLGNIKPTQPRPAVNLSTREQEVLGLVAKGKTNNDIAKKLYISTRTVKFHVSSILSKLNVKNRTEAALWLS